jgi:hypothetical protein
MGFWTTFFGKRSVPQTRTSGSDSTTTAAPLMVLTCRKCGVVYRIGVDATIVSVQDCMDHLRAYEHTGTRFIMVGGGDPSQFAANRPVLVGRCAFENLTAEQAHANLQGDRRNVKRILEGAVGEWKCDVCKEVQPCQP